MMSPAIVTTIETLRSVAERANDAALVIICDHALGRDVCFRGPAAEHEQAAIGRALCMSKSAAVKECLRRAA